VAGPLLGLLEVLLPRLLAGPLLPVPVIQLAPVLQVPVTPLLQVLDGQLLPAPQVLVTQLPPVQDGPLLQVLLQQAPPLHQLARGHPLHQPSLLTQVLHLLTWLAVLLPVLSVLPPCSCKGLDCNGIVGKGQSFRRSASILLGRTLVGTSCSQHVLSLNF